jgi:hypothetical protein
MSSLTLHVNRVSNNGTYYLELIDITNNKIKTFNISKNEFEQTVNHKDDLCRILMNKIHEEHVAYSHIFIPNMDYKIVKWEENKEKINSVTYRVLIK